MFMTKGKVMSGNREKLYSQVQYKTENRKEKFGAKIVRNYLLKFNTKLQTINLDVVLSRIEPIFKFFFGVVNIFVR